MQKPTDPNPTRVEIEDSKFTAALNEGNRGLGELLDLFWGEEVERVKRIPSASEQGKG